METYTCPNSSVKAPEKLAPALGRVGTWGPDGTGTDSNYKNTFNDDL
jgi:hypothetical protein